jgi:hypothetical protein
VDWKEQQMVTTAPQLGSRAGPIEATQVTGRRVVATIIDGLVFGVAYWLLALAFGDVRTEGEAANWVANLPVWASVAYGLFVFAYFVLLESYLGQTLRQVPHPGHRLAAASGGAAPGAPRRRRPVP